MNPAFPQSFPKLYQKQYTMVGGVRTFLMCHLGSFWVHCSGSFWILLAQDTVVTSLSTLQNPFKWATWEHHSYFLWENSRCPHQLPNGDITVTWSGTLWSHCWGNHKELSERATQEHCSYFFGKILGVPINYIMGTSQSHDLGHCECTDHSLGWGNCREIGWENSGCTWDVPGRYMLGTLSISLQCTCNIPAQDTTPCPQCMFLLTIFISPRFILPLVF